MIKLFDKMAVARFWDNWQSKFNLGSHSYIKPENELVRETAENISVVTSQSEIGIAQDISDWIATNHEYNLTKRWRKPEDTLREGVGDCEDYTFLLASLLPHFGVTDFAIVTGRAITDAGEEFHVWLEIDGEVIDPTASGIQAKSIEYDEELSFDIKTEEY